MFNSVWLIIAQYDKSVIHNMLNVIIFLVFNLCLESLRQDHLISLQSLAKKYGEITVKFVHNQIILRLTY